MVKTSILAVEIYHQCVCISDVAQVTAVLSQLAQKRLSEPPPSTSSQGEAKMENELNVLALEEIQETVKEKSEIQETVKEIEETVQEKSDVTLLSNSTPKSGTHFTEGQLSTVDKTLSTGDQLACTCRSGLET